ncbi:Lysophospholipase L1 [Paenibacillus uliginis N3/975]|uniref:Lysophospholipase L1 n=1 Tax=Paenibacillus uliginis N3/975 TaxID=1313296 RepID=A0A1X7H7S7_9BACL|nr:GDSL-type esterase/lipase family protein [Paenibacillus uliginis]SMF81204.1 Lysophospholipase L1 [Paenibacillus uliginis N3/975]
MVYHYTAVGDSLTFGIGAVPGSGFVPLYRWMSEVHLQQFVAYDNLGINGLTSEELYERVMRDSRFRSRLKEASIITISIGGNDLIRAVKSSGGHPDKAKLDIALIRCQQNMSGILGAIRKLKTGSRQPYIIRAVGLYNPYPSWGDAAEYVIRFNRYLIGLGDGGYFRVADVYSRFAGREQEMLSIDGVHPNTKGHRVIAEQLNQLGYKPLK